MKEMLEQYFTGKPFPEENCIVREGGGIVFSILQVDVSVRFLLLKNGDDFMEQIKGLSKSVQMKLS